MQVARSHIALAHLNGYIYAIGGKDKNGEWLESVERYDLSRGKWQTVAAMEAKVSGMYPSAVAFHERIFVSSSNIEDSVQYLLCFDPNTNTWKMCDSISTSSPGRLVHLDMNLLLVTNRTETSKLGKKEKWDHCPVVNEIKTTEHDQGYSYRIDHLSTHDQSLVPESDLRPFRVGKHICLMVNGACLDSRIDVAKDQVYDVDLTTWTKLCEKIEGTGITQYTFDAHRFMTGH